MPRSGLAGPRRVPDRTAAMTTSDPPPKRRSVACPTCKGPSLYAPENPYRPFCSRRCRDIDLGAWASESYRVEAESPPDDEAGRAGGDGAAPPPH